MNKAGIDKAVLAARAFLKRHSEWAADETAVKYVGICGTKTSGALRRASMDLTRALAEMRK